MASRSTILECIFVKLKVELLSHLLSLGFQYFQLQTSSIHCYSRYEQFMGNSVLKTIARPVDSETPVAHWEKKNSFWRAEKFAMETVNDFLSILKAWSQW